MSEAATLEQNKTSVTDPTPSWVKDLQTSIALSVDDSVRASEKRINERLRSLEKALVSNWELYDVAERYSALQDDEY